MLETIVPEINSNEYHFLKHVASTLHLSSALRQRPTLGVNSACNVTLTYAPVRNKVVVEGCDSAQLQKLMWTLWIVKLKASALAGHGLQRAR